DPRRQRLTLHVLHDDEGLSIRLAQTVDTENIGVVDPRERPRLASKTIAGVPFRLVFWREDLYRDLTAQRQILREIHRAHSPAPQHSEDPEPRDFRDLRQACRGVSGAERA